MLYLFITGINSNIDFARLEIEGNEYQRPLESLLELVPQHESLGEQAADGDRTAAASLAAKAAQIDSAFDALEAVDSRIGPELQFTEEGLAKRKRGHCRVPIVRKEWDELKTRANQMDFAARTERHTHLISDVRTMITHAGDMSNLILDPDLDSYYLMDATLLALPQTQDRLAMVMTHGENALQRNSVSEHELRQLAIDATFLKEADFDRIVGSVQTALNEDENFYGVSSSFQRRVPPALKDYSEAAAAFIDLTARLAGGGQSAITARAYIAAGGKARDASFTLWKIADEEVDSLLRARIRYYQDRRTRSLMVAACALMAAIGFVTFITRSISGPLRRQANQLRAANEALQAEIVERKRAEDGLRRSEAQLAAAQKIAQVGSWECDIPSNKITWSDENYRIHGVEPGKFEPNYESAMQLVHPQDRDAWEKLLRRAIKEGGTFTFEQRIRRPDGTERIVHKRGDVVIGPDGRTKRIVGTTQDMTERKHAEQELEKAHQKLIETSRQAGMAEVATGVLHNVGNVLNSVNVSASLVADNLKKSEVGAVSQVAELLREQEADLGAFFGADPRAKLLPGYITELSAHLESERSAVLRELADLQKNIEHIRDIVATQQGYARVAGVAETVQVIDLVEDALRMNVAALVRHDVETVRDFAQVPPITVEKHKVLQILVNLVRNAKFACVESGRPDKRMTLRVANGNGRIKISIADNGVGIPPENLTRVFNHGFTTRKDGHGFGLHSGALAAKELGGSLFASSGGPGLGATFVLELPSTSLKPERNNYD
jgi:PAS domain S-box-containing protein